MERSEIVVMRPDGGQATTVAAGTDPSWSPDGRLVLFKAMAASGELWVSVVEPRSRAVRRLARGVHPQWSPDGRAIVYMRDRPDGGSDVRIMARDGSGDRCLTCRPPGRG
jgi:TolB protein